MTKLFMFLFLLVLLFIIGCNTPKKGSNSTLDTTKLAGTVLLYENLYVEQADSNGFVDTDACDSLIETGLSNPKANLTAAEVAPGQWLRRPTNYAECFAAGQSRSDISRDGLIGVIFWALQNRDLGALNRMWDYGAKHSWVMGVKEKQHSIMTPALIALLARSIYYLGGGDYEIRHTVMPDISPADGFEGHLQAVQMLIKWQSGGKQIGDAVFAEKLYNSNNINPLYAVLANRKAEAVDLLLNTWPDDRLPTTSDWCTPWRLMQAPDGKGLNACPDENKTHSGGDFLFTARLILNQ